MTDKETKVQTKKVTTSNSATPRQAKVDFRKSRDKSGPNKRSRSRRRTQDDEFDTRIISIRRVTRVHKGGKRMRLSVVSVVGDKKGRVGMGVGKGADVKAAEEKATTYAKKHMQLIERKGDTIPHEITFKKGASRIFLKPAAPGTGIIAGSAVRAVVEVAGIKDILSKVIGSRNTINNAYATIEALSSIRKTKL